MIIDVWKIATIIVSISLLVYLVTPAITGLVSFEKPSIELFVMSFCPYGIEGEKAVIPAINALGSSVDFKVRFFATPQGTSITQVSSLHGNLEAQEDARQVCIDKYFPDKFLDYLLQIASRCPSAYSNATQLDSCWRTSANTVGISISTIESCYNNEVSMILDRFREDGALISKYGLRGSPSLVVNGVQVSPTAFSSQAYLDAICGALTNKPSACSQALSSSSAQISGSCG